MFDLTIEGLEELKAEMAAGVEELKTNLKASDLEAARDGVAEAVAHHPYTDRTGKLTGTAQAVTLVAGGDGAAMQWPQPYAGYVDAGTTRSKPYPYTPDAIRVATKSLETRAVYDAETLCERINSK